MTAAHELDAMPEEPEGDPLMHGHLARLLSRLANLLDPEADTLFDPDTGEGQLSEQKANLLQKHQLSPEQFTLISGGGGKPKELARVLRGYVESFM